jgi:hypothetical protein
LASKETFKEQ